MHEETYETGFRNRFVMICNSFFSMTDSETTEHTALKIV